MKQFKWVTLLSFATILFTSVSQASPGDEHWDCRFGAPGTTNSVFALALKDGRLYAGGYNSAGSSTNATLQVWDGLQWSEFAYFSGSTWPPIYDIAFVGDTLYVAGLFDRVNGASIKTLAKWDGNNWTSLGISGVVYSLAVDNGKLYAAGSFTNADANGILMTNIGCWNGSSWQAMGGGIGKPGSSGPNVVLATNGLVYAGGSFTNSGSLMVSNIAAWDGTSWASVGSGVGGPNTTSIYCLASDGSDIYAAGVFSQAGATSVTNVARWDGANWNAMGAGLPIIVYNLALLNGQVCAAGSFTSAALHMTNFAVWNGYVWANASGGLSAASYRMLGTATNVYVGGNFLTADGKLANGIATWDGANWGVLGTPGRVNGVYATAGAIIGDGTNLYAGGANSLFRYNSRTNFNMIARFDGTNWNALGSGITGPSSSSGPISTSIRILALSNNVLYAGGYFNNAGGVSVQNIAKWDGSSWSALGNPGGAVADILVNTNGVYAVGAPFYSSTLFSSPFCVRWNGSSWQGVLNFPMYTDTAFFFADANLGMAAIAAIGTNIYIGGHFYIGQYADTNNFTGYTDCANIMRFDGTYAWVVGTGLNSNVTSMAVMNNNLYFAGTFTTAGGIAASKIAMWNGNTWTSLGSGLIGTGVINGLSVIGNNLYVGGTFTNMGGVAVNRIAKWDGTNWSALGSGVVRPGSSSASVLGLGASGNDLFVSGGFMQAGNKNAFYFCRWNEQQNFDAPEVSVLSAKPFQIRLTGIAGLTNIIQATTNFTVWTPVLTNSAGLYDFTDPDAPNYPDRFYRAKLGP